MRNGLALIVVCCSMLSQGLGDTGIVEELDSDNDGKLSFADIVADMGESAGDRPEIVETYKIADEDGDGLLNEAEADHFVELVNDLPDTEY
mmetsp:Transcript_53297/g.142636  ORF Transcript_53297/g.142636 Transcript_53297/m.142636 type:complete len:91 (+) Transcript_53297:76-348(+)